MDRICRTLSQTGEGEKTKVRRCQALQAARSRQITGSVAVNSNRRRPFEYNLRPFPPTLQFRFASFSVIHMENDSRYAVGE